MSNLIFHNPRCSKSRETLQLLKDRGVQVDIVEYLDHPPSVDDLRAACAGLGLAPTAIIRAKESLFKELGLSLDDARSDEEWLQILHDNPKLIERPIVKVGEQYALGRPPENVLVIL